MSVASITHRAETANGVYTITREVAGGPFTPRHNGVAIRPAARLKDAKAACRRHYGDEVNWTSGAFVGGSARYRLEWLQS